jgi:hypothetical protein
LAARQCHFCERHVGSNATARPVAIFTLKNRTLSPVIELFIDCVRTVAKEIKSQIKR